MSGNERSGLLSRHSVRVPARIVDLAGSVLAVVEALATPGTHPRIEPDIDAAALLALGSDCPDRGPTQPPTLHWASASGDNPGPAPSALDDPPSGSALSSLDVRGLFDRVAGQHAPGGTARAADAGRRMG